MSPQDLKDWVVVPTLTNISKFIPISKAAINLVLGTAAQESQFHYLDQTTPGPGPAVGIYQCEYLTFLDNWKWLQKEENDEFYSLVREYQLLHIENWNELHGNLYLATIICRIHYFRKPGVLPTSVQGMAAYWKRYYNTYLGAGTILEFITNYDRFVKGLS